MRQKIKEQLQRLRHELGWTGQLAIALLVLGAVFYKAALEPMQARSQRLAAEVERHAGRAAGQPGASGAAGKLETFYSYLAREERTTDWLAKLYAIGKATGVELQSASYKTQPAQGGSDRIERYEIVLPVAGSYAQMREFLRRALTEIPVMSLDQMALKRETRNDGAVRAELKLTLHLVKQ
jgi:hypothetical protein